MSKVCRCTCALVSRVDEQQKSATDDQAFFSVQAYWLRHNVTTGHSRVGQGSATQFLRASKKQDCVKRL